MLRLQTFPVEYPSSVQTLRRAAQPRGCDVGIGSASDVAASDRECQLNLAFALCRAGCTYEAAMLLRPLRSRWTSTADAGLASTALAAQSWWNKHWRMFVQLKSAGRNTAALALLGDRAVLFWDHPSVLMHLGEIAAEDDRLDLAIHLYERVVHLSRLGLPKMNMAAFAYVSQAALADALYRKGDAAAALAQHRSIVPNSGNAMGHEIQLARLLVAAGHLDEAMRRAAQILVTAENHRTGYSRDMRIEFVQSSPDLAPLRARGDWDILLRDPATYARARGRGAHAE